MTLFDSPAVARGVLDGASDGIWLAYPAGVVYFVNDPSVNASGGPLPH